MKINFIKSICICCISAATLVACQNNAVKETIEIIVPITPKFDVDTIMWDKITTKRQINPTPTPIQIEITDTQDPLFDPIVLPITTIKSTQIRIANLSDKTIENINIWASVYQNNYKILIANINSIPPLYELEFIPKFVQTYAILPTEPFGAIKLYLPSINVYSNIQFFLVP